MIHFILVCLLIFRLCDIYRCIIEILEEQDNRVFLNNINFVTTSFYLNFHPSYLIYKTKLFKVK